MENKLKANELFGITEDEVDKLIKQFRHATIEATDMGHLAELLDINNSGKLGFLCYRFGREVEENQQNIDLSSKQEMFKAVLKKITEGT